MLRSVSRPKVLLNAIASKSLPPHLVASTSQQRHPQQILCRSITLNPLPWLSKQIQAKRRIADNPEELKEAISKTVARGDGNLFDSIAPPGERPLDAVRSKVEEQLRDTALPALGVKSAKVYDHHKYSTATFKISPRKLNMLGRQIAGKPIDYAILQMVFSEKRASDRIKHMLATARDHAVRYKSLDRSKLIVSQSWVTKTTKIKRVDIKGRGRTGRKEKKYSKMTVVLKEGQTYEQRVKADREKQLRRIRSAGLVREDRPLRNVAPIWAW